ncbi:MAG: hypothetical protein U0987_15930 [Afipia sp.]|jgi:hypothetical protein|nr:hypothetical protein [Afipia sp.]
MNRMIVVTVCALLLSVSGAVAKQKKSKTTTQPAATETSRAQGGFNPYAGGGPSGANQATNSPKASNEIGGGM